MEKCKYDLAWIGPCAKPSDGNYCKDHENILCCICKEKATRQCDHTGAFVCGSPLCDNCEHNHSGKQIFNQ